MAPTASSGLGGDDQNDNDYDYASRCIGCVTAAYFVLS